MLDHVSTGKKRMKSYARTPPRLHWVFSRSPLFFVTCCTYRRRPILARAEVHAALIDFANRAHGDFGIMVGRYVILPDHIHLFVAGTDDFNLGKWVGTLKRFLGLLDGIADCVEQWDQWLCDVSHLSVHHPAGGIFCRRDG